MAAVQEKKKRLLQWHPAFYADIRLAFAAEAEKLIFENEHQLGTKPKQIDVLVIKKQGTAPLQKNIGRIFKGHNIVEYKAPGDSFGIDDYYKVYGYACFYKADTVRENQIGIEEITLTLVSHSYPRELIRHLQEVRGFVIEEKEKGIYYVKGDFIPIQIIVTRQLDRKENLWLSSLTNELTKEEEIQELMEAYSKHQNEKLYSDVMEIIIKANEERFGEGKMCEALEELLRIKERMAESREEGISEGISQGKSDGGAKQIIEMGTEFGLSVEEILNRLQSKLDISLQKAEEYMAIFGKNNI